MTRYRFHPEAREELQAATRFYRQEAPSLASDFVAELRSVLDRLVVFPEMGSPVVADLRRVFLERSRSQSSTGATTET